MLGRSYAVLSISNNQTAYKLDYRECIDAYENKEENIIESVDFDTSQLYLKINVNENAACSFAYSLDNNSFIPIGKDFKAFEGRWVGAKLDYSHLPSIRFKRLC